MFDLGGNKRNYLIPSNNFLFKLWIFYKMCPDDILNSVWNIVLFSELPEHLDQNL